MSAERTLTEIVEASERAHERLAALVARYANGDTASVTDPTEWATRRLNETNALAQQARAILNAATPTEATVRSFLADAWRVGVSYTDRDLEQAAVALQASGTATVTPAVDPFPDGRSPRQLIALSSETSTALARVTGPVLRSTLDGYRAVVAEAARDAATGTTTVKEAARAASQRLAANGLPGFTDSAGRKWRLDTYTEMATRTAYQNSANTARAARYLDRGVNLVIVSDAPRECPLCRPWEGKVLTLNPAAAPIPGVEIAGSLEQARAAGLQHPRCRHQINAYTPGLTDPAPATADPEGYDNSQQRFNRARNTQRAAKRQLAAATASGDTVAASRARNRIRQASQTMRETRTRALQLNPQPPQ